MLAVLALSAALVAAPAPPPSPTATLTIQVVNLRNARGRVHVDLCDEAHFLGDGCAASVAVAARSPVTTIVVPGVAPGRYALQLFHDENGNDRADRAIFGIPKEGIAFSRDAPVRFSPPRWRDAVIEVRPGAQATRVTMRYFLGASGPAARQAGR